MTFTFLVNTFISQVSIDLVAPTTHESTKTNQSYCTSFPPSSFIWPVNPHPGWQQRLSSHRGRLSLSLLRWPSCSAVHLHSPTPPFLVTFGLIFTIQMLLRPIFSLPFLWATRGVMHWTFLYLVDCLWNWTYFAWKTKTKKNTHK